MSDSTIKNNPRSVQKLYSEITDTFTELIDLDMTYAYNALAVSSTLDQPVVLQFTNSEQSNPELLIPADFSIVLDSFMHDNVIKIKYADSAPSGGGIWLTSWRRG